MVGSPMSWVSFWRLKREHPNISSFIGRTNMFTMVLMYLNMLRSSEVLQLTWENLVLLPEEDCFELTLTWRKTRQNGEKQKVCRFHALKNPDYAHLCPWKALIRYLDVLPLEQMESKSKIIRRVNEDDLFDLNPIDHRYLDKAIVEALSHAITDTSTVGTHSFRRGGCQFFNLHCNWSIKQIAIWGGWSIKTGEEMNFSVICRYLNDYHEENSRFLDPMHSDNMFRTVVVIKHQY
jgi:hypothetical protein